MRGVWRNCRLASPNGVYGHVSTVGIMLPRSVASGVCSTKPLQICHRTSILNAVVERVGAVLISLHMEGSRRVLAVRIGRVWIAANHTEIERAGQAEFVPNPAYQSAPALDKAGIVEFPNLDLTKAKPLYTSFVEKAGSNWPFLWEPELFKISFPSIDTLFVF